jgi:ubiquinone/menaquinone biosynthesis C-methylase UbiE
MLDKYKLVGRSYETLSKLYSGNAINACRLAMITPEHISPGDKVLFAGAGQGSDAIKAAELGAQSTLIDISTTMMDTSLKLLAKHPQQEDLDIKTILGDILKHEAKGEYDLVVANFFLTIFEKDKMLSVLNHLIKLCKPGGKIVIGDFSAASGNLVQKSLQQAYWLTAATAFFAATGNAIHTLYDYREILQQKGLSIAQDEPFKVLGQLSFQSILAEKQ